MNKKLLILPPILFAVGVLAFVINQKKPPERKPPVEQARAVRVIEIQPTQLIPRVLGFGVVSPAHVWNASAQVSGEIVYVHEQLKKGAILEKGTEIIRISPLDYELAIREAEANIRSAEAKLKELDVSSRNTRQSLEIEKRAREVRETELERKRDLLQRGTTSQSAVDQEFRDTLAQRKKVQDLKNALNLIPTQIAVQQEQMAVSQAALEKARLNLGRTRIRLPFDARIAEVNAETTQYAQIGQSLVVADSMGTAEVEAQVPVSQFRSLIRAVAGDSSAVGIGISTVGRIVEEMGLDLTVRLNTGGEAIEWPGRFARISDAVDPKTRTIGVIAAVDGAYSKAIPGRRPPLTKGMFVEIEIRAKPLTERLVIPRAALHDGHVYIANADNRLAIRAVGINLLQGGLAETSSGVKAGDKIVVSDLSPAIEGMLLDPVPDEELSQRLAAEAKAVGPLK